MTTTLNVVLFNLAGTTPVKHLAYASGVKWLDELEGNGSFSFSIPVEEAGALQVGSVVKFALGATSADYVYAGVVESLRIEKSGQTTGGVSRTYEVSGRGLRARLEDAVVYPDGASSTRSFTSATAGEIARTLFLEAQARGALTGFTVSFGNVNDSNNDNWSETLTIDEQVGNTLGQVVDRLQELACDAWVTPALSFRMVNARGTNRTLGANPITLRVGGAISELSEELAGPVRNAVLVSSGTDGSTFTTQTSAGSISTYGRRETFVSVANTSDAGLVTLAAMRVLNNSATPADGATIQLDAIGPRPYVDFDIGDTVYVVDNTGTRKSYRVRSLTVTQDDAGLISYVPELGTARADFDKRLARIIARAERANAGGATDLGFDPEPEGGGSQFEVCTVTSYDPSTREGNADCSGVSTDFENGSIYDFYPGDEILLGDANGRTIAAGLVEAGGGGTGTQFGFVPPGSVGGLPYDPAFDGTFTLWQAGEGFVTYSSGVSVIDFVSPSVYTLPIPSPYTNGLALSRLPTGTFAFQSGADGSALPTSNGLLVRHNNTNYTHNYGGVRTIGVSQGVIYCSCTHKAGVVNPRIITIDSSGTVSDFLPTVQDELGSIVSYVGPEESSSGAFWVAGDWGIAWAPFTGSSNQHVFTLAAGSTAARRWTISGRLLYGTGNYRRWGAFSMNNTHVYSVDLQGLSPGDRDSWRRMNLTTGVVEEFDNHLPAGSVADGIAAGGNAGSILISGTYDNGGGPVAAYFTTNGGGVTVTTLDDTNSTVQVRRDFTGNILGRRIVASTGQGIVIGVSLS